jgi:hypothetical protein
VVILGADVVNAQQRARDQRAAVEAFERAVPQR